MRRTHTITIRLTIPELTLLDLARADGPHLETFVRNAAIEVAARKMRGRVAARQVLSPSFWPVEPPTIS